MRVCPIAFLLIVLIGSGVCPLAAQVPVPLYASQQSGEFTHTNGQGGKTTDTFERGTVVLSHTGPIKYEVEGGQLAIGPVQTKTWTGKIFPDMSALPAPGKSAGATLFGDYDVTYSRPQGISTGGTVVSTYECGEQGCPYHQGVKGGHEMINKIGQAKYEFIVYSLNCQFPKTTDLCFIDPVDITATGYPAGGTYKWETSSNSIELANTDLPTVTVSFKGPFRGKENIKCTYTTNGITYSTSGVVNTELPPNIVLNRIPNAFDASSRAFLGRCIGMQYLVQCLKIWSYFFDYEYDFENAGAIIASDPQIKQQMDSWYLTKAKMLVNSGQKFAAYTNEKMQWRTDENTLLGLAIGTSTYSATGNARATCNGRGEITVKFDVTWTITDEIDWKSYDDVVKHYGTWHWYFFPENYLDLYLDKLLDCEYNFKTTFDEKAYVDYKH